MGCNIHMSIEVRGADQRWRNYDALYNWKLDKELDGVGDCKWPTVTQRDYYVYGLLADVRTRDDVTPIMQARGIPEDVTEETMNNDGPDDLFCVGAELSNPDHHSASWYSLRELQKYRARFADRENWQAFIDDLAKLGAPDDVRIVFAFDN